MVKLLHVLLLNIKPGPPKKKAEHIRQVKGTISTRPERKGNTARRSLQEATKSPNSKTEGLSLNAFHHCSDHCQ